MSTLTRSRTRVAPADRRRAARAECRMILAINDRRYRVFAVQCDPTAADRCYELRKEDGTTYFVSQHPYGSECDCPDFIFHRDGLDRAGCKHIKALTSYGMIVQPVES